MARIAGIDIPRDKHVVVSLTYIYGIGSSTAVSYTHLDVYKRQRCGRPHSVLSKYKVCRICFRELAYKGQIPGVKKASW